MNSGFYKSVSFYATIGILVAFFVLPFVKVKENESKIAKSVKVKHVVKASAMDLLQNKAHFLWKDKKSGEIIREETKAFKKLNEMTYGTHRSVVIYLLLCIPFLIVLVLSDKNNSFKKIVRILLPIGSILAVAALYAVNMYINDDSAFLLPGKGLWTILICSILIAVEPFLFKPKKEA